MIEDGIKVFKQMLLSDALYSRIKVRFVDEHGVEEIGYDDGGLFKEFLVLLMKEVNFPDKCVFNHEDIQSYVRLLRPCAYKFR